MNGPGKHRLLLRRSRLRNRLDCARRAACSSMTAAVEISPPWTTLWPTREMALVSEMAPSFGSTSRVSTSRKAARWSRIGCADNVWESSG